MTYIVVVCAERELMPHEDISESYAELLELNPDADLTVRQGTFIYYGPFESEETAAAHAEKVEGGVHPLTAPIFDT